MTRAVDAQRPLCGELGVDDFKNWSIFWNSLYDRVDKGSVDFDSRTAGCSQLLAFVFSLKTKAPDIGSVCGDARECLRM